MKITFSRTHVYDAVDATQFLYLYARMNAVSLYPHLLTPEGAKNLLAARAVTEASTVVDPALPDAEFVSRCAEIGLFHLELP